MIKSPTSAPIRQRFLFSLPIIIKIQRKMMNTHEYSEGDLLALGKVISRIQPAPKEGMRTDVELLINEMLNAPKSYVKLDIHDICNFFQGEGPISLLETAVDDTTSKRMDLALENIKNEIDQYNSIERLLLFFSVPQEHPLLIEELQTLTKWIESFQNTPDVLWGTAYNQEGLFRIVVMGG